MEIIDNNTVVVFNETDLRTVLTGANNYNYIYFGSNITLTSGISIPLAKNGLIIDGTYEGITYTYSDPISAYSTGCLYFNSYNSSVPNMSITVQNLNVNLYNYYGVVAIHESAYAANTTLTYKNLNIVGSQAIFNPYGTTNIIDCEMDLGSASLNGEIAEAHLVNISGNTNIKHTYTGYHGFSMRGGDNQNVNILDNSNVTITCGRNLLYYAGNGDFNIGKNATVNITCPYGLAYSNINGAQNILFDTNSNVKIIRNASSGASSLVFDKTLTINSGAKLYMENKLSSNYLIYSDVTGATININDPAEIILYNQNNQVFYFTGTTNLNINARQINQWNTAPSIGNIDNLPLYHWQKDNSNIINLTGTATNTTTNITSNNFTTEELTKLPNITNLQLRTLRVLSLGYLPLLSIDAIPSGATKISGIVGNDNDVVITTPHEEIKTTSGEDGIFDVSLTTSLLENDEVNIKSSNNNYLYNMRTVTVVYPGELYFYYIPDQIYFKTSNPVSLNPLLFGRDDDNWKLQVYDSRIESTPWNIYATVNGTLLSENNHKLTDAIVYYDGVNINVLNENKTLVYTGASNAGETLITDVTWDNNRGILLSVENEPVFIGETYKTDIDWSIE